MISIYLSCISKPYSEERSEENEEDGGLAPKRER